MKKLFALDMSIAVANVTMRPFYRSLVRIKTLSRSRVYLVFHAFATFSITEMIIK